MKKLLPFLGLALLASACGKDRCDFSPADITNGHDFKSVQSYWSCEPFGVLIFTDVGQGVIFPADAESPVEFSWDEKSCGKIEMEVEKDSMTIRDIQGSTASERLSFKGEDDERISCELRFE